MSKHMLFAGLLLAGQIAAAEDALTLENKVDRLRTEISELRQLLAESMELDRQAMQAAATPAPAATPARNAVTATYEDGFYQFAGPEGRLKIGGYAQFDGRWVEQGSPGDSAFRLRRVRPDLRGELPNQFAWRIQGEFAGSSATLDEGWVEYRGWSWGAPKVGQFKEPFGLEAMYSPQWLDFVERTMISTAFAPMEDIGAGVTGQLLNKHLWYGVGVFNGRGTNKEDNQNDKDVAGRLQLTPWAGDESPWLTGLSLGVSATRGEQDETLKGAEYRSAARVPFIRYTDNAASDGNRDRWGADVEWFVGPASLKAEWMEIEQDRIFAGSTNVNATFDGWAVTLTCLLTGEDKPRNRALKDVGLGQGSWGAWEVLFRMEEFNADTGLLDTGLATGTDQALAYTAGLNWYPNGHVRLMLNGVHVDYDDEITVDGQTTDDEDVALLRLQYTL